MIRRRNAWLSLFACEFAFAWSASWCLHGNKRAVVQLPREVALHQEPRLVRRVEDFNFSLVPQLVEQFQLLHHTVWEMFPLCHRFEPLPLCRPDERTWRERNTKPERGRPGGSVRIALRWQRVNGVGIKSPATHTVRNLKARLQSTSSLGQQARGSAAPWSDCRMCM